jgi:sequestosome 1
MNTSSNAVSFKFVHRTAAAEPEVRRFTVTRSVATSLTSLQKLLASAFPNLACEPFRLTWTDCDGDKVSVGSDNELVTALAEMRGPVYKFNVESLSRKSTARETPERSSEGRPASRCSACERPVNGGHYRCVVCPNYTLCVGCEENGAHYHHNLVRMAAPPRPLEQLAARSGNRQQTLPAKTSSDDWPSQEQRWWTGPAAARPNPGHPGGREQVVETPFGSVLLHLLSEPPARPEVPLPEERKESAPKRAVQLVDTPFGRLAFLAPDEVGGAHRDDVRPEPRRSKATTPEPQGPKPGYQEKAPKHEGLELQLIDTPFGKMFYWIGNGSNDKRKAEEEKKSPCVDKEASPGADTSSGTSPEAANRTYEVKINLVPATRVATEVVAAEAKPETASEQPPEEAAKDPEEKSENSEVEKSENPDVEKSENVPDLKEEKKMESSSDVSDVQEALQAMLAMGFTDDNGWLTKLLRTKQGDVGKALDSLQCQKVAPCH